MSFFRRENSSIFLINSSDPKLFLVYCDTSKDFKSVADHLNSEYSVEIKEKRITLENKSSYPTFCLGIRFKDEDDKNFFLLKVS